MPFKGHPHSQAGYHVFLSHNNTDKPIVRPLYDWLVAQGISCWLDEKNLEPGDVISTELGKAMEASRSALICIGEQGEGPWQSEEMDTLLSKAIKVSREKDEFRIIPVLLPGADTTSLKWFLQTRLWVDLRKGITDNEAELLRLKSAILGERGSAIDVEPDFNPYRGLQAFQWEDARFFFGRNAETIELAERLRDWRFAGVVGPSGTGKSSLARAGLATDAAAQILPDCHKWKRLLARPGNDLLSSILTQLFASLDDELRSATVASAIARILPHTAEATGDLWAEGLNRELQNFYTDESQKVILLIDQFEEVFTHRGFGTQSEEANQRHVSMILDGLAKLQQSGDKRWNIVITIRADFYQRCRMSEPFWDLLTKEHLNLNLDELNESGWREAIKGPAHRAGAYLEAGLVEAMLKDVYRERGSMPLLQLALNELWRLRDGACLTHAAYIRVGGVANALQNRAETCFEHLKLQNPIYHQIAMNLFIRLTSPGEGVTDTRRRADRSELAWENASQKDIEFVLQELSGPENRLIVMDDAAVEVTHEVLIRECGMIRTWIEDVRSEIPMLRRVSYSASRWELEDRASSAIASSHRPEELTDWLSKTTLWLTSSERDFINAFQEKWEFEQAEKRGQQERLEKERERRVQEALQSKEAIRKRARIAYGLTILCVIALIIAANALNRAEEREQDAIAATKAANLQLARVHWVNGVDARENRKDYTLATHHFLKSAEMAEKAEQRSMVKNSLIAAKRTDHFTSFLHDQVYGAIVSATGSKIFSWGHDGKVRLWDVNVHSPLQTWEHSEYIWWAIFSPDESLIFSWGEGPAKLWDVKAQDPIRTWEHKDRISRAEFNADATRLLVWAGRWGSFGNERYSLELWDASSQAPIQKWLSKGVQTRASFSADGTRILTHGSDAKIQLWDENAQAPLRTWEHDGKVDDAVFDSKGSRILSWNTKSIRLWDVNAQEPLRSWEPGSTNAAFSNDESMVLSSGGPLRIWNAEIGESSQPGENTYRGNQPVGVANYQDPFRTWENAKSGFGATFNAAGSQVFTWGSDSRTTNETTFELYDIKTREPLRTWSVDGLIGYVRILSKDSRILTWDEEVIRLRDNKAREVAPVGILANTVDVNKDKSTFVVTNKKGGRVRIWDGSVHLPFQSWNINSLVIGASFLPDGDRILTWDRGGSMRLWDVDSQESLGEDMEDGGRTYWRAALSPDQSLIVSWSSPGLRLWDMNTQMILQYWGGSNPNGATFSADSSKVLTSHRDMIALWDTNSEELVKSWTHENATGAIFSSDESQILSWSAPPWSGAPWTPDRDIRLWSMSSPDPIKTWEHEGSVNGAIFTSDNSKILSWSEEQKIQLWDMNSPNPIKTWEHESEVNGAIFTTDDSKILSWGKDQSIRLWDVNTQSAIRTWKHQGEVIGATFNADESRVLSWSTDQSLRLWDVNEQGFILKFDHDDTVRGAEFNSDESQILSWSDDGTVSFWDLSVDTDTPVAQQILQYEVKSGAELNPGGTLKLLNAAQQLQKIQELSSLTEDNSLD